MRIHALYHLRMVFLILVTESYIRITVGISQRTVLNVITAAAKHLHQTLIGF